MAKTKNYLARMTDGSFMLARGEEIEDGLAVVHLLDGLEILKNTWCVIDIKSGLCAGIRYWKTKKSAIEMYQNRSRSADWKSKLTKSRQGGTYALRCQQCFEEKRVWERSGYEFD